MALLVLLFLLIILRDTSSGVFFKFQVSVLPSTVSVVMDTEYKGGQQCLQTACYLLENS